MIDIEKRKKLIIDGVYPYVKDDDLDKGIVYYKGNKPTEEDVNIIKEMYGKDIEILEGTEETWNDFVNRTEKNF